MMRLILWCLAIAVLVAGCDEAEAKAEGQKAAVGDRFQAVHVGTFEAAGADRAHQRCVYILIDTKTKRQYLAVEGCGTAQLVTEDDDTVEQ